MRQVSSVTTSVSGQSPADGVFDVFAAVMGARPCQYGIGCPFRASYWPIFLLINPTAASNAASISKSEVSSKSASVGRPHGGAATGGVALVPAQDVGQDGLEADGLGTGLALQKTAFGAHFGAGGDVDLGVGIWAYDGADIASVEYRAPRLDGERPLVDQKRGAHLRYAGDDRGGVARLRRAQGRIAEP